VGVEAHHPLNDRERLKRLLRAALIEELEHRAGLPRVTINDKRRKVRPRREWDQAAVPFPDQLRLPLYGRKTR
jgi:hypothetical protein